MSKDIYRLVVGSRQERIYAVFAEVCAGSSAEAMFRLTAQILEDGGLPGKYSGDSLLWVEFRPACGERFTRVTDKMDPREMPELTHPWGAARE